MDTAEEFRQNFGPKFLRLVPKDLPKFLQIIAERLPKPCRMSSVRCAEIQHFWRIFGKSLGASRQKFGNIVAVLWHVNSEQNKNTKIILS
jgi:hypothetical protein